MLIADFFAWSTIGGNGFNHVTVDINLLRSMQC